MGKTKECACIICGNMVTVSLYASPAKVKCPECAGKATGGTKKATEAPVPIDRGSEPQKATEIPTEAPEMRIHHNHGRIDGKPNKALVKLACPYHTDDPMEVVGVIKDAKWGDKVVMQCDLCGVVVEMMDRNPNRAPIRMTDDGIDFEEDKERLADRIKAWNKADDIVGYTKNDGTTHPVPKRAERTPEQQMVLDAILARANDMKR